ncbi:RNA polymerase sigma factor [Paractinoplanes brasiliensis]|uniref:DNA-directed RNA polymerase specialized sigma24 family protein n=1 Tax=Paractinoplanes brasiliensis TaxID=52695 RepID=A0A4R6JUP9_9ACTN|nr:sigma-70 family RNA polymerase sigma factor [Actinoplanes brasiliensis]TDO39542.1 DNA-directed RNA polymerase specialized sigma24 family protein [Actinoplanes brasiliensis]GID29119.1 hypothetical protein Abr02nite_41020 [Actinoplanes brasiliensis]
MDADNAVAQATAAPLATSRPHPPAGFAAFYRDEFKTLVRTAMYSGATREEAIEAAQMSMAEVLRRWADIGDHRAYGRKAVINNFIKAKTNTLDRVRAQQVRYGAATAPSQQDASLNLWEDTQWVMQLLRSLPPEQGKVMAFVVDGFAPHEIAAMLGRSPDAVRQSLYEARIRLRKTIKKDQAADHDANPLGEEAR